MHVFLVKTSLYIVWKTTENIQKHHKTASFRLPDDYLSALMPTKKIYKKPELLH